MPLRKSILYLYGFSMLAIFLHELGHHLLGIPSLLSLSHNTPLVAVTPANQETEIVGSLAGPAVNTLLGYAGLLLYRVSANQSVRWAGLYCGLASLFQNWFAAVLNLTIDLVTGAWAARLRLQDLEQASRYLGWNLLILPGLFVALSIPGWRYAWRRWANGDRRWGLRAGAVLGAWLLGGLTLMTLDGAFHIGFSLR